MNTNDEPLKDKEELSPDELEQVSGGIGEGQSLREIEEMTGLGIDAAVNPEDGSRTVVITE